MKFSVLVRYSLFTVLLAAGLAGCKQKLDITAPNYVELPVVYGLLNQQDNPHYIRIEKGYLLKGSAYIGAGNIDSIYYPDVLKVTIKGSVNGNYTLTRVNGNNIGLPKDPGVFASDSNFLYTFTGNLDPAQTYTLTIINTTSKDSVTSSTSPIAPFIIYSPVYGEKINLSNSTPKAIRWATSANAGVYDLSVRLFYTEFRATDNTVYKDTFIDVPFFKSYILPSSNSYGNVEFTEDGLIRYMASHITANIPVYRTFNVLKGMQFKFIAGGNELANFMNSQFAQSGLASSNALPPYTNINGGEGIFSSRLYVEVDSVLLTPDGLDSLACGSDSHGLNFKGTHGQTCN